MIDAASVILPWSGPRLPADRVAKVSPSGELLWMVESAVIPEGSWGAKLTLRTPETGKLYVSGNPVKFLQGHNLFGCDDLRSLVVAATLRALEIVQADCRGRAGFESLDLMPSADDLAAWWSGDWRIRKIDLTFMFDVGSTSDVRAWLRAASEASRMKYKRGMFDQGTLYFGRANKGERAKDESWKLYCKRDELDAHVLPELPNRSELIQFAEGKLRAELTLRTRALDRLGLLFGRCWSDVMVADCFMSRWENLEMSDAATVPVDAVQALPRAARAAFLAWQAGVDPRQLYPSHATLYRHRRTILDRVGADILVPAPRSNVVPLRRVLSLKPVSVPTWARGTSLYFDPEATRAA